MIYFCTITKGLLRIHNRKNFDADMAALEDGEYQFDLEPKKRYRSNDQNKYYWAGVIPIIQSRLLELGNRFTKDEIHEYLKSRFLKIDVPLGDEGEFISKIGRTRDLSTGQFSNYILDITIWAAEVLGIEIPPPLSQTELPLSDSQKNV